ncbi:hypothetical protein D3C75_851100 [compost metagenome]
MFQVVPLALPTRQAGPGHAVLRLQGLHVGGDLGPVELEQRLALFHHLTFAHQNLTNDAAAHRLHRLALARHHHRALHRNALIERRQTGPGEETASADDRQNPAQPGKVTCVALRTFREVIVFHRGFILTVHVCAAHTLEFLVVG